MKQQGIYTSYTGDNSQLIARVAELYLREGQVIADLTFGKGVFWKQLDMSKYKFFPSDIITSKALICDFCHLPYRDQVFDVIVFDPPYCHNPGRMIVNANYQNKETTKGFYHDDILQLYREGMRESLRCLKDEGTLWVKTKDEVQSSLQMMSHIEIHDIAVKELNMLAEDFFVLTQNSLPAIQFKQKHARKNHSYLWVFRKTKKKIPKRLRKRVDGELTDIKMAGDARTRQNTPLWIQDVDIKEIKP